MGHDKKEGAPRMKATLAALGASLGVAMMPVASAADGSVKPGDEKAIKQKPGDASAAKFKPGDATAQKGVPAVQQKAVPAVQQKGVPAVQQKVAPAAATQQKVAPAAATQQKAPAGSQQLKDDAKVKGTK
jgi:hypothetical protein